MNLNLASLPTCVHLGRFKYYVEASCDEPERDGDAVACDLYSLYLVGLEKTSKLKDSHFLARIAAFP